MLLQKYNFFAKQQRCTSQSFKQCGDLFLRIDYKSVVCADKKNYAILQYNCKTAQTLYKILIIK